MWCEKCKDTGYQQLFTSIEPCSGGDCNAYHWNAHLYMKRFFKDEIERGLMSFQNQPCTLVNNKTGETLEDAVNKKRYIDKTLWQIEESWHGNLSAVTARTRYFKSLDDVRLFVHDAIKTNFVFGYTLYEIPQIKFRCGMLIKGEHPWYCPCQKCKNEYSERKVS